MKEPPTPIARKLRSMLGMHRATTRDLALAVGVSEISAKSWANGSTQPQGINLENLAFVFGVSQDVLGYRVSEADAILAAAQVYAEAPMRGFEGRPLVEMTAAGVIERVAADTVVPIRKGKSR
jgi:transcriptional regulator with XRE-family HTH domain